MDGVILTPLKKIYHPKGDIYHAMKKSDEGYNGFGEVYFSTIHKNDIKGWKKHLKMTLNIVVPIGEIKFVVYNLDTKEFKKFIASQEAKDLLIKNTDELIGRGGFGSPTFFYKEKMFFGNDRLHLLEEAITKNLI